MVGLKYDFTENDITIGSDGSFITAVTDNQNVALIALSQVCRLTVPELGAQVGARLINIRRSQASSVLFDAVRMAESDGAKNVRVEFVADNQLIFEGSYEN